jgi:hypothetical protein
MPVEWQETGTAGAICYQIATKNQVGHRGLNRGGSAHFFMSASPDTQRPPIPFDESRWLRAFGIVDSQATKTSLV